MSDLKKEEQNNLSSSKDLGGFAVIILLVVGYYVWSNWKSDILHILSGIAVFAVVTVIISICTEQNQKARGVIFGIYFLGVFFTGVLSYISFGMTSWILLHSSLSWIYIFLMR